MESKIGGMILHVLQADVVLARVDACRMQTNRTDANYVEFTSLLHSNLGVLILRIQVFIGEQRLHRAVQQSVLDPGELGRLVAQTPQLDRLSNVNIQVKRDGGFFRVILTLYLFEV